MTIGLMPCGLPVWSTDLPLLTANQEVPRGVPRNVTNQAPVKRTICPASDQEADVCAILHGASRKTNALDHGGRNSLR